MQNVKTKRCEHTDCDRLPSYGLPGGKRQFCLKHKSEGMEDLASRRCAQVGCKKQSTYGEHGGRPKFCLTHKIDGMVDVVSTRCRHHGCTRQPVYGFLGSRRQYCFEHKLTGMENVTDRKCQHLGCKKRAYFGLPGEKAQFCSRHKANEMQNVVCKPCACGAPAALASPDRTQFYCSKCAPIGSKAAYHPCSGEACPAQKAQNPAYEGYCVRCFVHLFPDKPATRNYKTKERLVIERLKPVLEAEFPHLETSFDRSVNGGCSRRRPDVFVDALTHCGIGEIDEEGHETDAYCSCENRRNMEIFQDLGNRPLVIVRINPDAYTDAKGVRHGSCFGRDTTGKLVITDEAEWKKRVDLFIERMRENLRTIPTREVTVEHLYYNGFFCE